MEPAGPPPRDPREPLPEERRTEVIEEHAAGPPPGPPVRPPWQRGWWLLGLFGLAVLAGVLALIFLANDDDDEDDATPTTVTTTVSTTTVPETETTTEPTTTEAPETVSVPDAVGQDHVEAGAAVDDAGLIANTFPVPSQDPRGTVVAQSPAAGTQLDEGSPVQLNVSVGPDSPPDAQVPDVTGPDEADARATCREAGFTCLTRDTSAPSPEEVGEVVDQEPAAGTSAEELTQITLFVGR